MVKKSQKGSVWVIVLVVVILGVILWWWNNRGGALVVKSDSDSAAVLNSLPNQLIPINKVPNDTVSSIVAGLPLSKTFNSYLSGVSGMKEALSGKGPYTVFVPSDSAFLTAQARAVSGWSVAEKARLVEYHIVSGRAIDADSINYGSATTLSRDVVNFKTNENAHTVQVNNSFIRAAYQGSNGMVYVVSDVLLPPKK